MIVEGKTELKGLKASYRILSKLEESQISTVYIALETEYKETVAVKTVPRKLDPKGGFVRRFRQEARILNELRSRYIPAILDWGDNDEYIFIVMEHTPGKTAADLLAESSSGFLDEKYVLDIGMQVARALQETHANQIVHRDLNARNILVSRDNQVVIRDFGLAEHIEITRASTSEAVGTVAYMAPEQAEPGESVDIRADIYSLGAVMYEMLTGHVPFEDSNFMQLMLKIAQSDPVDISRYRSDLMEDTTAIVMRCLEKKPERRFQTPDQLAASIERIAPSQGESREAWLYKQAVDAYEEKDLERAVELCERLMRIDSNYQDVQGLLNRAKRQQVEENQARVERLVAEARKSLANDDWENARKLSQQILTLDPENASAQKMLDDIPDALAETAFVPARLVHSDGTEIQLDREKFTVGRGENADLNISSWDKDKYCSRLHSEFLFSGGQWKVSHHPEAKNPTKINRKKIDSTPVALADGDRVTFANVDFTFEII